VDTSAHGRRPVLVAPEGLTRLAAAGVLIAWKDTREARRTVRSALPFLRVVERVTIFEMADEALEGAALAHLDDLEVYLGRHRIKVSGKKVLRAAGSVSEQLKNTSWLVHMGTRDWGNGSLAASDVIC